MMKSFLFSIALFSKTCQEKNNFKTPSTLRAKPVPKE